MKYIVWKIINIYERKHGGDTQTETNALALRVLRIVPPPLRPLRTLMVTYKNYQESLLDHFSCQTLFKNHAM